MYFSDSFLNLQTLSPGTYWLIVMLLLHIHACHVLILRDYLLDISWSINCSMSVNANIIPINCISSNGSINLNVNGGVGPYSFDWSDGSSFQDLTNVQ